VCVAEPVARPASIEYRASRGQFMSIDSVRRFFAAKAPDIVVMEATESTATVALAAAAFGVEPGQIAKTLSLRVADRVFLLVTGGTARLHNGKAKAAFGGKTRMLGAHEVEALTSHPVGGVCPFGLPTPLPVYCDISLRAYDEVLPAAGSSNSAARISPMRLADLVGAAWVDVCDTGGASG
jgi:prolyl-tRNA editing enzyme YbaK/EbsC (Cys-tRNA(Pro) deacylase)